MVPVVRNTFRILQELARNGAMGLNEVTQRTGIAKSTVFRVLTTLNAMSYVHRDERRSYQISPSLGELVSEPAAADLLRRTALPEMLQLRDRFGETVNLGRLEFDKVIYLEVVPSEYALRLSERPGASVPAHASALGKAILAHSPGELVDSLIPPHRPLQMLTRNTITDREDLRRELRRVRERGYAFDRGETSILATCIGAPILDGRGIAVAALSISGPTSRFNPRKEAPVFEALLSAVRTISSQMHRRSPAENGTPDDERPGKFAGTRNSRRERPARSARPLHA
jgi:IclR family acetate operon transcriptional repressor